MANCQVQTEPKTETEQEDHGTDHDEKLRSVRCRNVVEFDFDYTDPVQLRAQSNVAARG